MRKNRKSLYLHSTIIRGRRFKDGEESGGGTGITTPPADANNQGGTGGNTGESGSTGSDSNNAGETFDANSFWGSQSSGDQSASSGESAGDGTDSGTGNQNFGEMLTQQLTTMKFGDPIFDAGVAGEINEGNFEGVQKRFEAMGQAAVRNSLSMMVQILKPFAEQIQSQMRDEFSGTLTGRDNQDALLKDFPAAKDPKVRPVVQRVFDQALKNTKGNRTEAVNQTKEMMRLLASTTAGDLGLDVAPVGSESSGRPANQAYNWLDDLTGR